MRAYVLLTGIVFGLLAAMHVWRYIDEGPQVVNAFFVVMTLVAAGLCLWSMRLLRANR